MDYSHLGKKRNRRKQNPHTTRIRNKMSLLVLRVTLSLVLIAGFALVGGGVGLYLGILSNAPEITPAMTQAESHSSFIIDANTGEVLVTLHAGHNHESVYIEQIPLHVQHAFVAIEDERFFEHNGIDIRGIGRAISTVIETRGARTEGASTITQQLIKNMLDNFEPDFIFKLQEQYLAVNFERQLTEAYGRERAKEIILESYLNIINLGRSNYGVQAAARFYYGVDVWDLTIAQAATIAAITQNPTRFPPDTRPAANWVRAQHVLDSMLRLGFITEEEFAEATREVELPDGTMIGAVYSTIALTDTGDPRSIISPFDCFTNALIDSVRDDLMTQFNWTNDQANRLIFGGGLRIYATQNQEMQAVVDRVFLDESYWPESEFSIDVEFNFTLYNPITNQYRPRRHTRNVQTMEEAEAWMEEVLRNEMSAQEVLVSEQPLFTPQPQAAFVLLDHQTGHVLALRGVRGESGANRTLNRATQTTRQPGSQLKTIGVFGPAFDMGIMHPGTIINDQPFTYIDPWTGTPWTPANHWSGFRGPMTARTAVYASANVVSARAVVDDTIPHIGMDAMFAYLRNMGISTLVEGQDGPAVALGGMNRGVFLIELAGAYGMVANGGMFNKPVLYTMVLDHEGVILLENPVNPTRVFRDTAAYLLLDTMMDTMTAPNATGHAGNWLDNAQLRRDIPIAGKTGTTQNNRDLGFTGSTPYLTAAIWMGNDNNERMGRGVGRTHLIAWRSIMQEIHENLPPRQFQRPADGRFATAAICSDSGLLAGELCHLDSRGNRVSNAFMDAHHVPTGRCDIHVEFTYCVEHGLLAGPNCHPDHVSTRVGIHMTDVFGGFPQGVLDGIVCDGCQLSQYLPWEDPNDENFGEEPPLGPPDDGALMPPPPRPGDDATDDGEPPTNSQPDSFIPDAPPDPIPDPDPGTEAGQAPDYFPDFNLDGPGTPPDQASEPDDEDETPYGL